MVASLFELGDDDIKEHFLQDPLRFRSLMLHHVSLTILQELVQYDFGELSQVFLECKNRIDRLRVLILVGDLLWRRIRHNHVDQGTEESSDLVCSKRVFSLNLFVLLERFEDVLFGKDVIQEDADVVHRVQLSPQVIYIDDFFSLGLL